jgi:rhodanese-related sulfurtransferase
MIRFRLVLKAVVILLAGSGVGLAYNALSASGIPLRTPGNLTPSEHVNWSLYLEGIRAGLSDAKAAFDSGSVIFLDARIPRVYAAGHIPGAVNLTPHDLSRGDRQKLEGVPRDARIITYCGGAKCQASVRLAHLLTNGLGFTKVRTFFDGWGAWVGAGYPVTTGVDP